MLDQGLGGLIADKLTPPVHQPYALEPDLAPPRVKPARAEHAPLAQVRAAKDTLQNDSRSLQRHHFPGLLVDEPIDLFRDVLRRIMEQHPTQVVVVINGKRNPVLEAVCDEAEFGGAIEWCWTPIAGKRNAVCVGVGRSTGEIVVLDKAASKDGKTSALRDQFAKLAWSNVLIIDGAELEASFVRAVRNLPNIDVLPVQGINVYDILRRKTLVLTKAAIAALEERFKDAANGKARAEAKS